jgi:RimJ/RimL family protein N-acetyltransferase
LEFEKNWEIFLNLIQKIAFEEVHFHKIYTFAFDLRPRLYAALTHEGFKEEARLSEHVRHLDTFIDVLIHSKFNTRLS